MKKESGSKEVSEVRKHGILSSFQTEFDILDLQEVIEQMEAEFQPSTYTARILVQQLAITYLRMLRCQRFESDILRETINPPEYSSDFGDLDLIARNDKATITAETLEKLRLVHERYEPKLFARFCRLLRLIGSYSDLGGE